MLLINNTFFNHISMYIKHRNSFDFEKPSSVCSQIYSLYCQLFLAKLMIYKVFTACTKWFYFHTNQVQLICTAEYLINIIYMILSIKNISLKESFFPHFFIQLPTISFHLVFFSYFCWFLSPTLNIVNIWLHVSSIDHQN